MDTLILPKAKKNFKNFLIGGRFQLEIIDANFCLNCKSLKNLDLSSCINIKYVRYGFLEGTLKNLSESTLSMRRNIFKNAINHYDFQCQNERDKKELDS